MQPRTRRQREILDYITRFMDRNGHAPSYQQMARQLGVTSRGGIQRHIAALENQGLITRRRENGSFGIELRLQKIISDTVCGLELIEVAGEDGRFVEAARSVITVPRFLIGSFPPEDMFAFRAPDDSMADRHICENDIVLLEKRSYARRGETVLARADDGRILLGAYHHRGLETDIRPANDHFESFTFASDEIAVQGAMRGLMRFDASLED